MNLHKQLELQRKTHKKKEAYKYFVGTTLKHPLQYAIGEKMVFRIRGKYMDDYLDIPYIWYSLVSDDGQAEEGYLPKGEDGWFYIEGSITKSGFVYVQAKACDSDKQLREDISAYNGSAGADIQNIRRGTRLPEDYLAFWDKLKGEVEATEPEVLYREQIEDPNYPDFLMYDMRIKAPGDGYASVSVAYPKDAEKGSLKFAMFFQGYGVNTTLPKPLAGYFTVSANAHSMPNRCTPEFYANMRENVLGHYGFDPVENSRPETTYWAKMLSRNLQALRFFKDHELLNKEDYYFVGSSQGGMQACNMAAHFEKATAVILNVPWLSDIDGHRLLGRRANTMPKGDGVAYFDVLTVDNRAVCIIVNCG